MKRFTRIGYCIFLALLLIAAVSVSASTTTIAGDSITSISPAVGYANGDTVTYTITGNNFTITQGEVRLEMSGESDIQATSITSWSPTTIVCRIKITSSKEKGDWDVVVVKGYDQTLIVKTDGFAITNEITLTSITPKTARAGNDDLDFTLAGTGLSDVEDVYLYNKAYDNLTADDVDAVSATKVTGTFDLTDADDDTYDVCVKDSFGIVECGLSFDITTNEVGSIAISSNPTGASIYIDGTLKGTTPDEVKDLIVGSHKIVLKKSGYEDWGKMVTVEADDTVDVEANLYAVATAATPVPTTNPTTIPRTSRTTVKSTIKIPTTYADIPTTASSPVDPVITLGAAGIGLLLMVLRRR